MNTEFKFKTINVDMSDIPSYASIEEATLYVVEANIGMFNNLKKEIGLQELGLFESTGNFVSYVIEADEDNKEDGDANAEEGKEDGGKNGVLNKAKEIGGAIAGKGKELIDKIIELVKAAAAKVKGLFEITMRKLSELVAKVTSVFGGKIGKNKDKLVENLKKTTIKFTSPSYDNIKDFIDKGVKFDNKGDIAFSQVNTAVEDINMKNVYEYFEGKSEEHQLDEAGLNDIIYYIDNFSSKNDALKKMYKQCESYFDNLIKDLENKKTTEHNEKYVKDSMETAKESAKNVPIVFGAALSSFYKLIRLDVGLILKLAVKGKFAKNPKTEDDKKNTNESASFSSEVESLFNWSF